MQAHCGRRRHERLADLRVVQDRLQHRPDARIDHALHESARSPARCFVRARATIILMNPATATPALPARPSMAGWAALALALVAGFYLLTLLLAVACIYLPYLALTQSGAGLQTLPLSLAGLVMAGTMLASLVPPLGPFN